jgi:hypothetical protein
MRVDALMSVGRNITTGLLIVSGVVCIPLALLASAVFAANNLLAIFYPWSLIIGGWGAVWALWRTGRWIPASVVLMILISFYLYFWFTLELP